jgi:hypothetical protein
MILASVLLLKMMAMMVEDAAKVMLELVVVVVDVGVLKER